ncbi:MAG TPA: hypothetical protein VGU69_13715 [Rhizomicrobium sp.]|nr:hypothetical protein [Rhizomicrobium sp.]
MPELDEKIVAHAKKAIAEYGSARTKFRAIQDELKEAGLLVGNDNKVGIAGEFWAFLFYHRRGYQFDGLPRHTNNKDFDFAFLDPQGNHLRISVKSITAENSRGTTTRVSVDGSWDELCIVQMSALLSPERIGTVSKAKFSERFRARKSAPATNRKWLSESWLDLHEPVF